MIGQAGSLITRGYASRSTQIITRGYAFAHVAADLLREAVCLVGRIVRSVSFESGLA